MRSMSFLIWHAELMGTILSFLLNLCYHRLFLDSLSLICSVSLCQVVFRFSIFQKHGRKIQRAVQDCHRKVTKASRGRLFHHISVTYLFFNNPETATDLSASSQLDCDPVQPPSSPVPSNEH